MNDFDLVVVGGGLSGMMSALFAALREKKVLLITKGSGVLAVGGGTIDLFGCAPDGTGLDSPFAMLDNLPPRHPYSLIGSNNVRRALRTFLDLTKEESFPYVHDGEKNMRVLTALGSIKHSFLVPESMNTRHLDNIKKVFVIGVEGLKDFAPVFISQGFAKCRAFAGKKVLHRLLPLPFALNRDLSTLDLARYLDLQEGHQWLAQSLLEQIGFPQDSTEAVVLPPILGTKSLSQIHTSLRERLGREVWETVGLPPAITGLRLHHLLLRLLKKYRVELIEQATVTASKIEHGHCLYLSTNQGNRERRYHARAFIIATGGILGDGFVSEPHRTWEPILNLDLHASPDDPDWSQPEIFTPENHYQQTHSFSLLGPRVDNSFRPLTPQNELLCDNVFFVGKSLGGYDHTREKSGNGVAISTAWHAVHCALGKQ